jgi:hypothetical protein
MWAACSSLGIDASAWSITLNALWSCGREMVPAFINADNDPCLTTEDGSGQRTPAKRIKRIKRIKRMKRMKRMKKISYATNRGRTCVTE